MNTRERGKGLGVKLSLVPLPWGELNSLLENLLYRFLWNAVTLSRTWAGDELHSFVLSWFVAFNTPRQQSPKSFSQRFIFSSGEESAHSIFCAAFVPEVPWPGSPFSCSCCVPQQSDSLPMKPQRSFLPWAAARAMPRCLPTIFSILGLWWGWAFLNWKYCHPLSVGGST